MKLEWRPEWVFVGVGSLMTAGALYSAVSFTADIWKARASSEWPVAPGKVFMSEWGSYHSGAAPTSRGVWMKIRYFYQVAGREWEGTNVTIGNSMANADLLQVPTKYPAGSAVPVYYRAGAPADSVLEPGIHLAHFIILVVPLLLGGMGLLFLCGGVYHLRREPTSPPAFPSANGAIPYQPGPAAQEISNQ